MRIAIAGATGFIGSQLTALARKEGHEVVEISRETGFDLMAPDAERLEEALTGAESIVDVTQGPFDPDEAMHFCRTVAGNLGRAATAAGVSRTVVLSIVGIDRMPDNGYYAAKLAQEEATRAAAPGPIVLRATQFHDFARQMFQWNRDGDVVSILDVPTQPVDTAEVVRVLLDLATGTVTHDIELAGPSPERLVDLVERYAAHIGDDAKVVAVEAAASQAAGGMLPASGEALLRGIDWATWLAQQPA